MNNKKHRHIIQSVIPYLYQKYVTNTASHYIRISPAFQLQLFLFCSKAGCPSGGDGPFTWNSTYALGTTLRNIHCVC